MIGPTELEPEEVVRGESWTPPYVFQDADGVALDPSSPTVTVQLRLKHRAAGTELTRTSTGGAGTEVQLTGTTVRFIFDKAAVAGLALGLWDLEATYQDTAADPDYRKVSGRGIVTVSDPRTGTLP